MRQDNSADETGAPIIISATRYDKRALSTTDPISLAISLSNLNNLCTWYPTRMAKLLQQNGGLELLIKRLIQVSYQHDRRSLLSLSNGLGCLCTITATGGPQIRFRIVQARIVYLILPKLQEACRILEKVASAHSYDCENIPEIPQDDTDQHNPDMGMNGSSSHDNISPIQDQFSRHRETSFEMQMSPNHSDNDLSKVTVHDLLMVVTIVAYISKYEATRAILHQYRFYHFIQQLTIPKVI